MSKRLQVIMDDSEYAETQEFARRHHQTTAEWVRAALREARQRDERTESSAASIRAVQIAAGFSFPTGDISQMLEEIESGYKVETL